MTHTHRLIRRLTLGVLLALAACSTAPEQPAPGPPALEPSAACVRVIFDTDLGIDVDDAGALALLHALANKGEVRILATVSNVNDPYEPAALDAGKSVPSKTALTCPVGTAHGALCPTPRRGLPQKARCGFATASSRPASRSRRA